MKHGDKNTKNFHSKASQCRRKNHIHGIKNANEQWVEEVEEIVEVATNYFDSLFNAGVCDQIQEYLNVVAYQITPDIIKYCPVNLLLMRLKRRCFK